MIKGRLGQPVFGTITYHFKRKLQDLRSNEAIELSFDLKQILAEAPIRWPLRFMSMTLILENIMSCVTMLWCSK
jgi:hypothetical protein